MTRLDRRDYEAVLSFLEDAHAEEGPAPFTPPLLDRLTALASCELATFFELTPGLDVVTEYIACSDEDPADRLLLEDDAWRTCARTIELRRQKSTGPGPVFLADVFSRDLRAEPEFNFNYRDSGVVDEIHLDLDGAQQWTAQLVVFGARDFGTRERLLLTLLRPHLRAHYRAASLRRRLANATAATEELTPRECEVVELMAEGLSNAQIARALVVEPCTVRKHLEHVYEKLGVGSRTAALAKLRRGAAEPAPLR